MKNIAIIGSGSFGCALAHAFGNKNNVKMWSFTSEEADSINKHHCCLLVPAITVNKRVKCYLDYESTIKDSDIVILASPSHAIRKTCFQIKEFITNQDIIIASKGMENDKVLSQVIEEELGISPSVLSGPSHAEEIAKDLPTFVDFAGNEELIKDLETDTFHLTYIKDKIGMQISAAYKNVIALANGVCEANGFEKNTISYLIVTGLKEIKEIGIKLGGVEETFYGLSGLGDLLATAFSDNSRNKRAGMLLSKGYTIEEILKEVGMIVEGFEALKNAKYVIDKYQLNCPITDITLVVSMVIIKLRSTTIR